MIFLSPLVVWFPGLNFALVSLGFSGLKKTSCLFLYFLLFFSPRDLWKYCNFSCEKHLYYFKNTNTNTSTLSEKIQSKTFTITSDVLGGIGEAEEQKFRVKFKWGISPYFVIQLLKLWPQQTVWTVTRERLKKKISPGNVTQVLATELTRKAFKARQNPARVLHPAEETPAIWRRGWPSATAVCKIARAAKIKPWSQAGRRPMTGEIRSSEMPQMSSQQQVWPTYSQVY